MLDVWGTTNQSLRVNHLKIAVDSLRLIVRELESLMDVNGIRKEITAIHLALDAIKTHMESRIENCDSRSINTSQEFKAEVEYDRAGFLIPLACGHGGPFSSQEKFMYEQHLLKARFTSYNY